jgi:hypothetical protein
MYRSVGGPLRSVSSGGGGKTLYGWSVHDGELVGSLAVVEKCGWLLLPRGIFDCDALRFLRDYNLLGLASRRFLVASSKS